MQEDAFLVQPFSHEGPTGLLLLSWYLILVALKTRSGLSWAACRRVSFCKKDGKLDNDVAWRAVLGPRE